MGADRLRDDEAERHEGHEGQQQRALGCALGRAPSRGGAAGELTQREAGLVGGNAEEGPNGGLHLGCRRLKQR
jgi:hypothetical protein